MSDTIALISALETAPGVIIPLIREVPAQILKRRPSPTKWSAYEHAIHLSLSCSCGGSMHGTVSAPLRDAFKMRDIFLSFHREDGHVVTDKSEDRA